jgi:hypothetical protein
LRPKEGGRTEEEKGKGKRERVGKEAVEIRKV